MKCRSKLFNAPKLGRIILSTLFMIQLSCQVFGGIVFDGSPGTNAPPSTLGGFPMIPFAPDNRPLGENVLNIPVGGTCPAEVTTDFFLHHYRIGLGWATWSHGYTGDVYATSLANRYYDLPAGTRAIYFYVEPDNFGIFQVIASANDGTNSGVININGNAGAHYIGFYTTNPNCMLTQIKIITPIAAGGFAVGEFGIFADNPNNTMACDDDVQVSLDENCEVTINPDVVLEGNYNNGCSIGDFIVEVRDWNTKQLIDDNNRKAYPQLNGSRIGHKFEVKVIDPYTGNSCWGIVTVEDKLAPIIECPSDITEEDELTCTDDLSVENLGVPHVWENCSTYDLQFLERIVKGSCELGYDKIIYRTWIATDAIGNRSSCTQTIRVGLGSLDNVDLPPHYDGLPQVGHENMLFCDQKIDRNKDYTTHYTSSPECVDDYLVDKKDLPFRHPRVLGWNCLDKGPYAGHPSPDPVYYPAHPNGCFDDNDYVMWQGTQRPSSNGCNHINATYNDVVIDLAKPGCDAGPVGCYKILRTWTMVDWCTSEIRDYLQIIKVVDTTGPQITYPDSVVVDMEVWRCFGRFDVPKPWITDNCSNTIHYTVESEYGNIVGDEEHGFVITDLPLGLSYAYIIAEDCCGNITKKKLILDVQDNTPPVAVCDKKTVVSITGTLSPGENTAKVYAETFDDGSFDNCSQHIFFKVIRMEDLLGTANGSHKDNTATCNGINGDDDLSVKGNQVYFDDVVKFCCADAGKTNMVVFRVFDTEPGKGPVDPDAMNQGGFLFHHFSDCMIEVEVQDKSIPTVVAPPDVVVNCSFWFDIDKLSDPHDSTFGKIVNDVAWRRKVVTQSIVCSAFCEKNNITGYPGWIAGIPQHLYPASNKACEYFNTLFDPAHPDKVYDLLWGYDGYILSACGAMPSIVVDDLRECGQGRILRNFIARGATGSFVRATQTIWVVDCDPFYVSENRCDPNDDINWPDCSGAGTIIEGCGADTNPDKTGRPTIVNGADDNCALIAIEHFDEVFTIEPDACFKVLRKWVVIDWCQYDPVKNPERGRWEYTQIIKVRDRQAPKITSVVGDCEPASKNPATNQCMAHVNITAVASDSCTPSDWLFYEYYLDMNNDGNYEYHVGSLTKTQYERGETAQFHNNPFADDPNNSFAADGIYPIGEHHIRWFVEDGCGNRSRLDTSFVVKDCKAPTPYCLPGVITVPMPSSGCVDVWAKDLDHGSYDNCTDSKDLKFYFNGDPKQAYKRVCCDDFIREKQKNELIFDIEVWVEDEEGNKDFCKTLLIIQDNNNICPDPTLTNVKVTGLLKTNTGTGISPATVDLFSNGTLSKSSVSNKDGEYSLLDVVKGSDYLLRPNRNDEAANGITTADIVKLQKHILAQEIITNPYTLIAADVNKSGTITASDITELRKLILGSTDHFSKMPSWTFVPSSYIFTNPAAPWNYPTEYTFTPVDEHTVVDFIGIKMGDINNSAKANGFLSTEVRTQDKLHFIIDENSYSPNEEVRIPFTSNDFKNANGFQFTLAFDPQSLSFDHFEAGSILLSAQHVGLHQLQNGKLTMSWNKENSELIKDNEKLFTLVFKSLKSGNTKNSIKITDEITKAEAYSVKDDIRSVELLTRKGNALSASNGFELFQNVPNPFSKQTEIGFMLSESSNVRLTIYDLTGKVYRLIEKQGVKGYNAINIVAGDHLKPGMYYYQLDANNNTDTKRMIIVD